MAGKTQFTEHWTVNLTSEQSEAVYKLMQKRDMTKQDLLSLALMKMCVAAGIEWPQVVKKPIGNRTPRKAKFMKP